MTTKQLTQAIPTVNEEGKTQRWSLTITYSCDSLTRNFRREIEVGNLNKEPEEFTKEELLNLCNIERLDALFEIICNIASNPIIETTINDFNVENLS